jgi:membrane protein involved in colicin uptake
MSISRRALLSILGASVVYATFRGIASAKGGGGGGGGGGHGGHGGRGGGKGAGRDGAMDTGAGIVTSPVGGKQVKTFKSYQGKQCNRDYKRLCPTTPIGKCDLAGRIDQLSPSCKAFVEAH